MKIEILPPEEKTQTEILAESVEAQYQTAVEIVTERKHASTHDLRAGLGISYGLAVRMMDKLEARGVIAPLKREKDGEWEYLNGPRALSKKKKT